MWWDDEFNPEEHGDPYERLWGHFIEKDFSEWKRFWSHHVVPATNRIVDHFHGDAQEKLYIRFDPQTHPAVEELVMSNYSVFYYLARSCAVVTYEPHLFIEDAFIFLRAAAENAGVFLACFKSQIAPAFGIGNDQVPDWKKIKLKAETTYNEIVDYRDALVHRARLGRNPKVPWEFIPRHSHISHIKKARVSWRYIQGLPEDQFVDGRKHLRTFQRDFMEELNPAWGKITQLMDERRNSGKYQEFYRLERDASGELRSIKWPIDQKS
jgi:hypothetical protein